MQLDNKVINLLTGQPYQRQVLQDITVRDAIIEALLNATGPDLTGEEKAERASLAEILRFSNGFTLEPADIARIKVCCYAYTSVGFIGAVLTALDSTQQTLQ